MIEAYFSRPTLEGSCVKASELGQWVTSPVPKVCEVNRSC